MGQVMRFDWVFCVGYGYNLGYSYGMVLMLLHLAKLFLKVVRTCFWIELLLPYFQYPPP